MKATRSPKRRRAASGVTFLEVLTAAVFLGVGAVGTLALLTRSRASAQQVEHQALALNVVTTKLHEYLAKSYSQLQRDEDAGEREGDEQGIHYRVRIGRDYEVGTRLTIPYRRVRVTGSYEDKQLDGRGLQRQVRLTAFVPYPTIHMTTQHLDGPGPPVPFDAYGDIGTGLRRRIDYAVPKDVQVAYSVAIQDADVDGVGTADMILTGCFLDDDATPRPVETGTPIISQPLIHNVLVIEDVPPGPHEIHIRWKKDTQFGTIALEEANLIVVAFEDAEGTF